MVRQWSIPVGELGGGGGASQWASMVEMVEHPSGRAWWSIPAGELGGESQWVNTV